MDDDQLGALVRQMQHEAAERGSEMPPAFIEQMVRKWVTLSEVGYPAMELESERAGRRSELWTIFAPYMGPGAKTWTEIIDALSDEVLEICGDETLAQVLELE